MDARRAAYSFTRRHTTYRPTERAATWGDWLRVLTDAQREAVCLCWVEGYTYREAGARLGIAHTSVQARLEWARKKYGMTVQTPARAALMSEA